MKVLQICNHFYPCVGGMEDHVENLCKNLIKMRHQSDVACLDTCAYSKEKLPALEEYEGSKVYRLPYINLKFYKPAAGVFKLLKDYDMVHVHGIGFFSDFVAMTKFIHKKPMVLTTHGGFFHTKKLRFIKKLYFIWNRLPLKTFDKAIAVSKSDEDTFSPISPDIMRIPNGISLDEFTKERRPEPATLLFVGRISKNKRIDRLIEITSILQKSIPDIKLKIVGEDWEGLQTGIEELALKRGVGDNVEFLGKSGREELIEYLSAASLFVSASEYEGFGISAVEAMAAGCVVVLNDIPAFNELVNHSKNGYLSDFADYESTATLLQNLMEKDQQDVSKEAIETAAQYDWKTVAKKIELVYVEVMREATRK